MPKIEVFFDHTCPYCYRGLAELESLLPRFPSAEIVWRPVEAHPKVEEPEHKPYADLAVRGALYMREAGKEEEYNRSVFKAYFERRLPPDDVETLAACAAECGESAERFAAALRGGEYESELQEANDYAYGPMKVWAVPAFVCGQKRLDSVAGIGVTRGQLEAFLRECR
ncbi:MAG: DsbA family protein [Oscillospiraceae bacterium]|jgi:predicted DsbA family dithiol-disulfide isomerase|nr:DsbA family protein [Oscillospiraceae bacterium]